ncbi:hypothetical protein D477_014256 [Arthrobacter crystallopoietes BAB-32]|uniref:Uncharacterized protein n=1 Tax=Arthrobacter crystallopoietes BAB-32 TaxID=1246476 RepID=N1UT29_9MICC|nr:hypothetical protein [Arthrobacter crystallopoietes]EMY33571.1 hypothetical protein D477_014256 [Arthrobacter crystallopoietes BAB-32]
MTTSSDKDRCPDDGACHHNCVGGCFRVRACGPLSGVYPGDRWPAAVVETEVGYPERQQAADIIDDLFDDYSPSYDEAGQIVTSNIAQALLPVIRAVEERVRREAATPTPKDH